MRDVLSLLNNVLLDDSFESNNFLLDLGASTALFAMLLHILYSRLRSLANCSSRTARVVTEATNALQ